MLYNTLSENFYPRKQRAAKRSGIQTFAVKPGLDPLKPDLDKPHDFQTCACADNSDAVRVSEDNFFKDDESSGYDTFIIPVEMIVNSATLFHAAGALAHCESGPACVNFLCRTKDRVAVFCE
jgi:hypothetical protein